METQQGTREGIAPHVSFIHRHFQQPNGRWVAELELLIDRGFCLDAIQGLEARDTLDFGTEDEAMHRNRTLARNWVRHDLSGAAASKTQANDMGS